MTALDALVEKAVQDRVVAGAAYFAKDASGKVDFGKVAGRRSLQPGHEEPMTEDTIFTLASMTKLLTTIAVLQVVEKGLIKLEDDVTSYLPVLAEQQILTGFSENGEPILHKRKNPILLRQLLTHSEGSAYVFSNPLVQKWLDYAGKSDNPGPTINNKFGYPLFYEPGEGWTYSPGMDWAGHLVEKLTDTTLEDYMHKNMFPQLGIENITFWPRQNPKFASKLASLHLRNPETGEAFFQEGLPGLDAGMMECAGGQGGFANLKDYLKILYSILVDDEKLLKKETTALMFQPQLSPSSKKALLKNMEDPAWMVGNWPFTGEYDWGFGGILVDGDKHKFRRRHWLSWSGAANLFWFIDREAGVCGVFGSQLFPPADTKIQPLLKAFEEEVYAKAGKMKK